MQSERLRTVCKCWSSPAHPLCLSVHANSPTAGEDCTRCNVCAEPWGDPEHIAYVARRGIWLSIEHVGWFLLAASVYVLLFLVAAYLTKLFAWLVFNSPAFGFCWGVMCVGPKPSPGDLVVGALVCLLGYATRKVYVRFQTWRRLPGADYDVLTASGETTASNPKSTWGFGTVAPSPFGGFGFRTGEAVATCDPAPIVLDSSSDGEALL